MTTDTPAREHDPRIVSNRRHPTPEAPWLIAVEGVTRARTNIRARYRDRTTSTSRERKTGESIEWQAGLTLADYRTTVALAHGLSLRIVPPGAYDLLHKPERGGAGRLDAHYPLILTGNDRDAPRPPTWAQDTKTATGRTRGQHERAAWAIAIRAATDHAGLPWTPNQLLGLGALPPAVGVDPGAEWTGIVACIGPVVLEAATIGRAAAPAGVKGFAVDLWLVERLYTTLARMLEHYQPQAARALAEWQARQQTAGGGERDG